MKTFKEFVIESALDDNKLVNELKQLQSRGVIVKLSPRKATTEKLPDWYGLRDGIEYSFYLNYDNYIKSGKSWDFSSIRNNEMKKEIENPSLVTISRWINKSDKYAYTLQTSNPLIIHFRDKLNFQKTNVSGTGIQKFSFNFNKTGTGDIGISNRKGFDGLLKFLSKNYTSKTTAEPKTTSKPVKPTINKPTINKPAGNKPTINKPAGNKDTKRGPREIQVGDQIESKNNIEFTAYVTAVRGNKVEVEFDDEEVDPLTGWSGDKKGWCNISDIRGDSVKGFEVPKWTF